MQILKIYPNSINDRFIEQAVAALRDGEVIIYPTDSLYAFACDALNKKAIERLCHIKKINPDKNLLSIVCSDISQAAEFTRIDNNAFQTIKLHTPGPFTFILPASTKLPKIFKGRKTVGVRIPANPIATTLAKVLGNPLLTSSVLIDEEYPENSTEAETIAMTAPAETSLIIDGGHGYITPTTIIDLTDSSSPQIIREGLGKLE